ncbi:hypothetical protein LTR86_004692 [Recurvomyces mirabilis]|nr:hypothetical protein LTR86_004692 [Recurvomyces mirabilis]
MFTTLALSSLLLAAPAVLAQSIGTGSCTDVHIFIARGWNEDYPGRQGNLTTRVCNDLPGMTCDYEDIAYDAYSTDYCPSVDAGEALALSQINAYYAKCPETAIVLSGYSEGATVIGNVLAGDTGDVFCPSSGHPGLTDTTSGPSCNIAAVTLFGNPRHTANQPYNVLAGSPGMANSNRSQAEGLDRMAFYTPRLHDYCNYDDLICAPGLGANTVEAHTNYFELYSAEAAQYIADLVKSYTKGKYCAVPTTSSSSSSAAVSTSLSTSGSSTVPVTATASASASSNASFACNPAHSYPNGASCISTAGSLTLFTPSASTSVAQVTVTELTSVYTTVCPQTSVVTSDGTTSTSTWTGPSTVTSTYSSTVTTTVPVTLGSSSSSAAQSVPYVTVTDLTSIYTTVCPQTSIYTTGNLTRTSTWTGPSTVTSKYSSTLTTTVAATYVAPVTATKSAVTTLNGTPAVVSYTSSVSTTTYANFPTLTFTNAIPTATYWLNNQGSSNGTKVTGFVASGSAGGAKSTSTGGAPITPYTGAASSVQAAKWLAAAAGVVGLMMI